MKMTRETNSFFIEVVVIISILVSIDFWSYIYLPNLSTIELLLFCSYIVGLFFYKKNNKDDFIDIIVKWTILSIFLSIISSIVVYGQDFYSTFRTCLSLNYGLFLYFLLKRSRVDPYIIIKIVTAISIIWVFLEIFQQFTYPNVYFSGRLTIYGNIIQRMGLWRVYIWGVDFVMLAYAYWLGNIYTNRRTVDTTAIILMIILLIGLLCYCSRKHVYVALLVLLLFSLQASSNNKKIIVTALMALFFYFLYDTFYMDWEKMNLESNEVQGEGEDFIRYIEANYFLFDFSDSPLYPIFGAGMEVKGSSLYRQIQYISHLYGDFRGYYQADVGIIGYYSKFGLLGVSAIIMYIVYFLKNWRLIDNWLKYFFIMKIILIVFDFWAIWDVGMMAYSIFLYLLGCNIRKNNAKLNLYENRHLNIPRRT